jgi:hypothetical protein
MFALCSVFMGIAAVCQIRLERLALAAPAIVVKGIPEADALLGGRSADL